MSVRKPRASSGDMSNWSNCTRKEFEKFSRSYKATAIREKQNPERPNEQWLAKHLLARKAVNGRSYMRRYARNIGHFLTVSGHENLIDGKLIRAVLNAPDDIDPLALDLEAGDLPFSLGRAQAFVDDSYKAETYALYSNVALRWKKRCDALDIDWLRPPEGALEQYFEECAVVEAASTLNNRRNALSHHFRKHDVPDISRIPSIDRILEGIKRVKPPRKIRPATPEMRSAIFAEIENEGAGIRDRCCVLLTSFTGMTAETIALVNAEHCTVTDDGVKIQAPGEPAVHVGRHHDRDLDLAYWLTRLLELVPPTGPLFRLLLARRMRFGDQRMSSNAVLRAVGRPAERAGVSSADISARLRKLFAKEVQRNVSSVVYYHSLNRKSIPNDPSAQARAQRMRINNSYEAADGQ